MKKSLLCLALMGLVVLLSSEAGAYLPDFGFESGDWGDWYSQGSENKVLGSDSFISGNFSMTTVLPNGNFMARINSYNGEGDGEFNTFENYISQIFTWEGEDLSFWYNFFTWDYYDYDAPGFAVDLDDEEIILEWDAGDLDDTEGDDNEVNSTGWQQFNFAAENLYDWGYEEGDEIELILYAGNTGDDDVPSWVYIDDGPGDVIESNVIPEPATMSLLGLGILGLAGLRRKK